MDLASFQCLAVHHRPRKQEERNVGRLMTDGWTQLLIRDYTVNLQPRESLFGKEFLISGSKRFPLPYSFWEPLSVYLLTVLSLIIISIIFCGHKSRGCWKNTIKDETDGRFVTSSFNNLFLYYSREACGQEDRRRLFKNRNPSVFKSSLSWQSCLMVNLSLFSFLFIGSPSSTSIIWKRRRMMNSPSFPWLKRWRRFHGKESSPSGRHY